MALTNNPELQIETLTSYSDDAALGIGALLPSLSERFNGEPVEESLLRAIIASEDREQFVARMHGTIVGAATLNLIYGVAGKKAWLEDFVTSDSPEVRGKGVGYALWAGMEQWCMQRAVDLRFTSNASREAAHAFYARQGAVVVNTTVFHVPLLGK